MKRVPVQPGPTRRQILTAALGGAAGFLLSGPARALAAAPAQAADPVTVDSVTTVRLGDDLFLLQRPGESTVVVHIDAEGVVLVDGASAGAWPALREAVAALPGGNRPIHTLFNTHWHPEVTGANAALGAAGTAIIAQENTRLWLTTDVTWPWDGQRFMRLPRAAHPNQTFYTTGTLESGVRYGYIPDAAHTDGDLYVHFPGPNVLAAGHAVTGAGWPVVDWATGGWIGGMVGGLQRLLTLADDDTRIVPGYGPVLSLTDLAAQYEMYTALYERLTRLLNSGRGPDEAVAARPAAEFEARMGPSDEFVRRAFESLWAYLSPDA